MQQTPTPAIKSLYSCLSWCVTCLPSMFVNLGGAEGNGLATWARMKTKDGCSMLLSPKKWGYPSAAFSIFYRCFSRCVCVKIVCVNMYIWVFPPRETSLKKYGVYFCLLSCTVLV